MAPEQIIKGRRWEEPHWPREEGPFAHLSEPGQDAAGEGSDRKWLLNRQEFVSWSPGWRFCISILEEMAGYAAGEIAEEGLDGFGGDVVL